MPFPITPATPTQTPVSTAGYVAPQQDGNDHSNSRATRSTAQTDRRDQLRRLMYNYLKCEMDRYQRMDQYQREQQRQPSQQDEVCKTRMEAERRRTVSEARRADEIQQSNVTTQGGSI